MRAEIIKRGSPKRKISAAEEAAIVAYEGLNMRARVIELGIAEVLKQADYLSDVDRAIVHGMFGASIQYRKEATATRQAIQKKESRNK